MLTIGESSFEECKSLKEIKLPDGLTTIGKCAFYASGLTSITIPASVTNIVTRAFMNCTNLESIIFMGDPPSIEQGAFTNVSSNFVIYVPKGKKEAYANIANLSGYTIIEKDLDDDFIVNVGYLNKRLAELEARLDSALGSYITDIDNLVGEGV